MKLFVCLFLICFIYIYPECSVSTDLTDVKKDVCLARTVSTYEAQYPCAADQKPDTCCLEKYTAKVAGVKAETTFCHAYEKSKVEDYVKKYKDNSGLSGVSVSGLASAKFSIDCSSSFVQFGFIALLAILF